MGEKWEKKLERAMEILSDQQWHSLEDFGGDSSNPKDKGKTMMENAEKIGAIEVKRDNGKQWRVRGTELIGKILELPEE